MISEDAALAHAFSLHPELQDWKDSDYEQAETKRRVNWRLHLQLDAVVFRRASDDALPDAGVIRELEKREQSRIDAIHEIATLVAEDLWERMKQATGAGDSGEVSPDVQCRLSSRSPTLRISSAGSGNVKAFSMLRLFPKALLRYAGAVRLFR